MIRQVLQTTLENSPQPDAFEFLTPEQASTFQAGDVVLALGEKGLSFVRSHGIVPKNRTINSLQATVFEHEGVSYMVGFDPGAVFADWGKRPFVIWSFNLAARLHETGSTEPKLGDYRFVKSFNEAIAWIKGRYEQTGKAAPIALDLETMGLDPYKSGVRIITVQITYRWGASDVLYLYGPPNSALLEQIDWLLNSECVSIRGANLKFDLNWIKVQWGLDCTRYMFDTTIVGSLLDENRNNSLNLHTKIYAPSLGAYDDKFSKEVDKAHMEDVDPEKLLPYAGGDSDATQRVAEAQKKQLLKDPRLANFYVKLLHPANRVFEKMERRGIYVDAERYETLSKEVEKDEQTHLWNAFSMVPRGLRIKHAASPDEPTLKPALLADFMFGPRGLNLKPKMLTAKSGQPSTALEHMEMFADHPDAAEFLAELKEYRSASKTRSTYIDGFRKHIREDGMFHPTYLLHRGAIEGGNRESGTVSGRTSAKDPAFQTLPKHTKWSKALREVYVPPPGYVILIVDFSQGELRVGACVANEQNMISAYREGIDVHLITGCSLNKIDLDIALQMKADPDPAVQAKIKEIRQGGKAGNFGLIYGMQAPGFVDYARKEYGVHLSLDEATEFRDGFFAQWPGFLEYHSLAVKVAQRHKAITSPLGRTRHLPLIDSKFFDIRSKQERQAINSPIQSTLSDLTQLAMVEIDRAYPELHMFGMTHDSISLYVPEDSYMEWARELTGIMSNLPLRDFGWQPDLDFPADAEVGFENMGHTDELDLASDLAA